MLPPNNRRVLTFQTRYFRLTLFLFITEVLIALFVRDDFIRPYAGDFLVVILLYCFIKTFIGYSSWAIATGVLLFSYFIEVLQYFHVLDRLGLSGNIVAKTVIGYGFEWWDMLAYTLGAATALFFDTRRDKQPHDTKREPVSS